MARIDPSRRGGIDEPREKIRVLRESSKISKMSKKPRKKSKSTPHSYQHMLGSIYLPLSPST